MHVCAIRVKAQLPTLSVLLGSAFILTRHLRTQRQMSCMTHIFKPGTGDSVCVAGVGVGEQGGNNSRKRRSSTNTSSFF